MSIKVKCNESYESGFSIGKVYELKGGKIIDDDNEERPMNDKVIGSFEELREYYSGCGFELAEFTLNDLKPFMLVERRNGGRFLVSQYEDGYCIINRDFEAMCGFESYQQSMQHVCDCEKDIVIVYGLSSYMNQTTSFSINEREVLWREKKDEVHISLDSIRDKFNLTEDTIIVID